MTLFNDLRCSVYEARGLITFAEMHNLLEWQTVAADLSP